MDDSTAPVTPDDLLAHAEFLRALARSLTGDEHRAEDVVQDAFLVALRRPHPPRVGLRPWLTGVTKNLARLVVRGESRRRRRELRASRGPALPGPEEVAARLEGERRLVRAVSALPEPYRSTVVHRYYEGLSATEIASRAGIPAATVRTRLHRALALLREELGVPLHAGRRPSRLLALGGFVTMKKALAAAVLVLLVGAGIRLALDGRNSPERAPKRALPVAADARGGEDAGPVADAGGATPAAGAVDAEWDLRGVVRDPDGSPIAGARIETSTRPEYASRVLDPMRPFRRIEGPGTVSGPDGRFSVRLPRGAVVDLRVSAEDRGEAFLPERAAGDRVEVVLGPAATLIVRISGRNGAPVAGAKVFLFRAGTGPVLDREGETDGDGECRFAGLGPGMAGVLAVHARHGLSRSEEPSLAAGEVRVLELTMPERRALSGTVTDAATGRPVPGALVTDALPGLRAVRTGDDGRYELPSAGGFPKDRIMVFATGYRIASEPLTEAGPMDFELEPGSTCEGRVVQANGAPIAGAQVSWIVPTGRLSFHGYSIGLSCETGEDGRFRLAGAGAADGAGHLLVTAPGFGRYAGPPPVGDIVLPPAGSISGTVTDREGEPRVGTSVELRPVAVPEMPVVCRTTHQGRFTFTDLPPGDYTLTVYVLGERPDPVSVNLPEGEDVSGILLPRPADGTLTVVVTDDAGRPVEGARVYARTRTMPSVLTDAAGRATFTDLPGGALGAAVAPERPEHRFEPTEIRGLRADGREVRVTVATLPVIEGRVLDPDGNAVPGAYVLAEPGGPGVAPKRIHADGEGKFRFLYPAGTVVDLEVDGTRADPETHVSCSRLPLRGERLSVAAPSAEVTIRTRRVESAGLTVRVLDPDGEPAPGVSVFASTKSVLQHQPTNRDGIASFPDLPPEEHEIRVQIGRASALPPEALEPESQKAMPGGPEVVARFRRGILITGVVLDPEGHPAANVGVSVLEGREAVGYRSTNGHGRFAVPVLGSGPYRISAAVEDAKGDRLAVLREDVEPGGPPLTLKLTRRSSSTERR